MSEIDDLKKRAGITEQETGRVKAFMDMKSFLAFAEDVTGHIDRGAYNQEVLDRVTRICDLLGRLSKSKMRG